MQFSEVVALLSQYEKYENTIASDKEEVITEICSFIFMQTKTQIITQNTPHFQNDAALKVYGDGVHSYTQISKEEAAAVCRFLLRLLRHRNKLCKLAGRMILSQRQFTENLKKLKAWDVLHDGTRLILADISKELKDFYVNEKLQKRLGSYQPSIYISTCRQDLDLPYPSAIDWTEQGQEEIYIHFLRLIAYAIDENYQKVVADCVEPKKHFSHKGIKAIKSFPRMLDKMLSAADHRYAKKPRPGR